MRHETHNCDIDHERSHVEIIGALDDFNELKWDVNRATDCSENFCPRGFNEEPVSFREPHRRIRHRTRDNELQFAALCVIEKIQNRRRILRRWIQMEMTE